MIDNITPILNTISNHLNIVNSAFQSVYEVASNDIDSSSFDAVRSQIEAATASTEQLQDVMREAANIEWVTANNIEIFNGNNIERYTQEVEAANEMMRQMTFVQEQISTQAANMKLLPSNAIDDINGMGDRIAALRSRIEDVQNSRIQVIGIEQANSEVEVLRGQLSQALQVQEDMNQALQNMDASGANRAYHQLNNIVNQTERNIRDNINEQQNFNTEIVNGERAAGGLKRMIASVVGAFTVRAGISWLQQSLSFTNENIRLEQQLANVMSNRGATYEEFVRLQERAAQIQADTNDMISGTTMIGAANELARHVGSVEAIEIMMDSLADFASGAGNIFGATAQDMAAYAEYFTQAMAGNYRMLERRAGIYLTETQKEVIKYGDDMQRALMIQDIVNQSWAGLAEQMAATPEGMQAGMINAFNDIRSSIGAQLMPVIMILFYTIREHMPQIEAMLEGLVPAIEVIIQLISQIINVSFDVYNIIVNNWSFFEPIIWGIVAALAAWKLANILLTIKVWLLNSALIAKNALLAGIPLIIGAIVVAIAALVNAMGGWQVVWLITVDRVLTTIDILQFGFYSATHFIMDTWDNMIIRLGYGNMAIINFMEDMRVNVLSILESMLNSAIDNINNFIRALNLIPIVNIAVIEDVTFGTQSMLNNELARQARMNDPSGYFAQLEANIAGRAVLREQRLEDLQNAHAYRQAEIEALRTARNADEYVITYDENPLRYLFDENEGLTNLFGDVSDIAGYTGRIANISDENLKYWRDIAERDNINRYTIARVNLRIDGIHNTINNEMDLDSVIEELTEGVEEAMYTTAERVNDYHGV